MWLQVFARVFSQKKLAMIFEFQIDFRYDLHSPQFSIVNTESAAQLTLPPLRAEISVRSLCFYDAQRSMPSLRCSANSVSFGASTGVHVRAGSNGKRVAGPNTCTCASQAAAGSLIFGADGSRL